MITIHAGALPGNALLTKYVNEGAFTDCYRMDIPASVAFEDYVEAFYTSGLFRIERTLLGLAAGRRSTDKEARQLAVGLRDRFSAWSVEGRAKGQLLLCDFTGRTRSWLMSEEREVGGKPGARLYFGSAVMPLSRNASGVPSFGFAFHALSGFHRLYSRALMSAASSRLGKGRGDTRQEPDGRRR